MTITVPDLSLVVLLGASGSGKSTFARTHFRPTEVLSSDFCRGLVSDDENDQAATQDAFSLLHTIAGIRLRRGHLCVIDATNVQSEARKPLIALARRHHVIPVAIVLNLPESVCHERNRNRPDRSFGPHVVRQQRQQLRQSLGSLRTEGFRHVFVLDSAEAVASATVVRQPLWTDKRVETGPFDIVGDVHGCLDELLELLVLLGYAVAPTQAPEGEPGFDVTPPPGRKLVFLGDLVDRGPATPGVLRLAMGMVAAGTALCVPGNHDMKLMRALQGRQVQVTHGLAASLEQLGAEPDDFRERVKQFLDSLISHYVLDGGRLVVAHAGMKEELQGRGSREVRDFALYGETTGETDEFGLPVRHNWAQDYRGKATVVYGHTPVPQPDWLNHTLNIDTGCVFGGRLTALRYPERELVSVEARREYAVPARPIVPVMEPLTDQQRQDELLDLADVAGKRLIPTRIHHTVSIREENGIAALEVMARFAVNPKWLIYLPPTMSPAETSDRPGLLEHPFTAFDYFQREGVERLICQEKHMGSRAVVICCRDEETARKRFGILEDGAGCCYTRSGRRFFDDPALETAVLGEVRGAMERSGLWDALSTDWVCLDCELMPWSAKAQALIREQYAPVGAAALASLSAASAALSKAAARGLDVTGLRGEYEERGELARRYAAAYQRYCWEVTSPADLKLAPFHLLASEGACHADRSHLWHMEHLGRLFGAGSGILLATRYRLVEAADPGSRAEATAWWEELTAAGGEGMVVKPLEFTARRANPQGSGLVQPAVKCRGAEYLRIIYGPEYSRPEHLERLRKRGLAAKRSLALREFALGVEALERFVAREPLRRVHECVFGVLALESEPVDPRL